MQPRGLSPDEVLVTALKILDELGLPDLTMRRLAAALDVQPSALYWHFPSKQALLAALADRILSDAAPVPAIDPWESRLRGEAAALRDALLAHRDSAEIVSSSLALGIGRDHITSRLTNALDQAPLPPGTAHRAVATMRHFLLGHVSLEQQRQQYDRMGARVEHIADPSADATEEDFRFGTDTIIAGLAARVLAQETDTSRAEDDRPR